MSRKISLPANSTRQVPHRTSGFRLDTPHLVPEAGAGGVFWDEEMGPLGAGRVVDFRRVRRDDELGPGLQRHEAAQDRPVPLRVQVQLRLVDEDDPLAMIVQGQGRQEQEQLDLTGTETVDLEASALRGSQEEVKP